MAKAKTKVSKVKTLHFSNSANTTEADFMRIISQTNIQHYINQWIFQAIKTSYKKKLKSAKIFEIGGTCRILTLTRDQWLPVLEKMLSVYEELELFKNCIQIRDLIKELSK